MRSIIESPAIARQLEGIKDRITDSLFSNAFYLLSNSLLTSGLGYLFWILASRVYTREAVGLAGAVMSALGLIAALSDLGLGIGLIRFLPQTTIDGSRLINTVQTITGTIAAFMAFIFLLSIPALAPNFIFIYSNPTYFLLFVPLALIWSQCYYTGSFFMAKRRSSYALRQDVGAALLKLLFLFPVAFVRADAMGIVLTSGIALGIALFVAVFVWLPKLEVGYYFRPDVSLPLVRRVMGYSLGNFLSRIFLEAHILLLPILTLHVLGPENNGLFYIAWISAQVLRVIPNAVCNSLFAEGVNDRQSVVINVRKSLRLTVILLLPPLGVLLAFAGPIMHLFGRSYAEDATSVFRLLLLANVPWSVSYLVISVSRVLPRLGAILSISLGIFILTFGLSWFLMKSAGLLGAGWGYLIGHTIVAGLVIGAAWLGSTGRHDIVERQVG